MGSLLSTLGQTMGEVDNVSRSWPEVEGELLVLCDLREGAVDMIAQGRKGGFADVQRDGAGLDLGQIQNIVDDVQKSFPASSNNLD